MKKLTWLALVLAMVMAIGSVALANGPFPGQSGADVSGQLANYYAQVAAAQKIADEGAAERARLVEANKGPKPQGDIGGVFAMSLARTFNPANFSEATFKMYAILMEMGIFSYSSSGA